MYGGAEVHAANLVQALRAAGYETELISVPFKWYPGRTLLDHITLARLIDLREADGTAIDRVIGLKFPAYLIPHPNKVVWLLHQHRTAYELWDHPVYGDLIHDPEGLVVRDIIRAADRRYLAEAKAIYANSHNVAKRLKEYCALDSVPLYHPPNLSESYYSKEPQQYLFFPSRINPMKRQSLVLKALAYTEQPVRVVFAGAFETKLVEDELKELAQQLRVSDRVQWRGRITEEEKLELYANCLGVVYTPWDEDYGYVTLEAMLASKPVITTTDAGGPLEFVQDNVSGLITSSEPKELAAAMDELWSDTKRAVSWGKKGRDIYDAMDISWSGVVEALMSC